MTVRRVVINDRLPRPRRPTSAERDVEREEQARTIKIGDGFEPQISRADEQAFADAELERRAAERREHARQWNAKLSHEVHETLLAVGKLGDTLAQEAGINKRTRHGLQQIRSALRRIQSDHTAAE